MKNKTYFYCIDKTDAFGKPLNMELYGQFTDHVFRVLHIMYRPCVPRQRTDENKDIENCLIDDMKNQT